jgi:hypothetical protein
VNARNLNRQIHTQCLRVMEASCLVNEGQRQAALADILPGISAIVDQIEGSHADEVLAGPGLIMYGWLYNQHKEILESLVSDNDLDAFFDEVEAFAND